MGESLQDMLNQVKEDRFLKKALEDYLSSGNKKLLNKTQFDSITNFNASEGIKMKLEANPDYVNMLRDLFEEPVIEDEETVFEDVTEEKQDSTEGKENEKNETKANRLFSNQRFHLPKLV